MALPERSESPRPVRLVPLPIDVLAAMLDRELDLASRLAGVALPSIFLTEDWLWRIRLDQVRRDPARADWVVRAVVDGDGASWPPSHPTTPRPSRWCAPQASCMSASRWTPSTGWSSFAPGKPRARGSRRTHSEARVARSPA